MAVKTARTKITFECTECKHRNYDSLKNKKNDPDRLVLKKYCLKKQIWGSCFAGPASASVLRPIR